MGFISLLFHEMCIRYLPVPLSAPRTGMQGWMRDSICTLRTLWGTKAWGQVVMLGTWYQISTCRAGIQLSLRHTSKRRECSCLPHACLSLSQSLTLTLWERLIDSTLSEERVHLAQLLKNSFEVIRSFCPALTPHQTEEMPSPRLPRRCWSTGILFTFRL